MASVNGSPAHHLPRGTVLNSKYEIVRSLGEGGFGITYKGKDNLLDMDVAIKEYFPSGYANRISTSGLGVTLTDGEKAEFFKQWKEKFLIEARTLARLNNIPYIVRVRDFFEENGTAYIVMDYLEGKTLKAYVAANGVFSPEKLIGLLQPMLLSLDKIHKQGLIHRDISPDNIMYMDDGYLMLYDFGAARNFSLESQHSLSVLLKHGYAPQEQYRSKGRQGPWTDIYAICATIYYCITGTVPEDSMQRVFEDELVPPSKLGIKIAPHIEAVLMKGLEIRENERFQSIPEMITAFTAGAGVNNVDISKADSTAYMTEQPPIGKTAVMKQEAVDKTAHMSEQNQPSASGTAVMNNPNKTAPAKSADPNKTAPAKSADPNKTAPAKSADPNKTAPAKSADPNKTAPAKSADPNKTAPAKSADPNKTEPAKSADPNKTAPAKSADPNKTAPAKSADLKKTAPAKSADPNKTEPAKSADPNKTEPAKSAESYRTAAAKAPEPSASRPMSSNSAQQGGVNSSQRHYSSGTTYMPPVNRAPAKKRPSIAKGIVCVAAGLFCLLAPIGMKKFLESHTTYKEVNTETVAELEEAVLQYIQGDKAALDKFEQNVLDAVTLIRLDYSSNICINCGNVSGNGEYLQYTKSTPLDTEVFTKFKNIEDLILPDCELNDISGLSALKNLKYLNLKSNEISDVSPLEGLTNLNDLNLSYNNIKDVSMLDELEKLTSLNLSNNEDLTDISVVKNYPELTQLDLSGNAKISDISPIYRNFKLEKLALSSPEIDDLSVIASLTYLKDLEFNCTRIEDFSPLTKLTRLQTLSLKGVSAHNYKAVKELSEEMSGIRFITNGVVGTHTFSDLN